MSARVKSLWPDDDRRALIARIGRLEAGAPARWGRMRAPQMVAHLIQSLRMATGELPVPARRSALRHTPLKEFVLYLMPFPKGLPTAPELLARVPADWEGEVGELQAALERFVQRPHDARWPAHPLFGPLTSRQWGVLQHRHADHHLRQFNV